MDFVRKWTFDILYIIEKTIKYGIIQDQRTPK